MRNGQYGHATVVRGVQCTYQSQEASIRNGQYGHAAVVQVFSCKRQAYGIVSMGMLK